MTDLSATEQRALSLMLRALEIARERNTTTQGVNAGPSRVDAIRGTPQGSLPTNLRSELTSSTLQSQDAASEGSRYHSASSTSGPFFNRNMESRISDGRPSTSTTPVASGSRGLQEIRSIFSPYSTDRRGIRRRSAVPEREWTHRFFCLNGPGDTTTPSVSEKAYLQEKGIGDKSVITVTGASSSRLRTDIVSCFPQLENVEFELLRSVGSGHGKNLLRLVHNISIPPLSLIIPLRPGIVYIRPLTKLFLDEDEDEHLSSSIVIADSEIAERPDHGDDSNLMDTTHEDNLSLSTRQPMGRVSNSTRTSSLQDVSLIDDSEHTTVPRTVGRERDEAALEIEHSELHGFESTDFMADDILTLEQFRIRIYAKHPGVQPILMTREDFFESLLGMYLKDKSLNLFQKPHVKFMFEIGRDLGGLTREYFHKALTAMNTEKYNGRFSIFEGVDGHLLPSLDACLLRSGVFKSIGKLLAHSLIHTGVGAYGLSRTIVEYLLSNEIDSQHPFVIPIKDVTSMEVREVVDFIESQWISKDQVLSAEWMQLIAEQAAIAGFNAELSYANSQFLKDALIIHNVIDSRRSQLEDIKRALRDHEILAFLSPRPYLWDVAFPPTSERSYSLETIFDHIIYQGDEQDRMKAIFRSIIMDLLEDPNGIKKLLLYWTSWPLLTNEKLVVDTGEHDFFVHTCFNKIEIPTSMPDSIIKSTIISCLDVGGFGGV